MAINPVVSEAARVLEAAAPPGSQVLLFGSHARGDARKDSDADFMVIEPHVAHRRAEMVRLRDAVRPLRLPVDIVVVSRTVFDEWRDTPNTVIYDAAHEGVECGQPSP